MVLFLSFISIGFISAFSVVFSTNPIYSVLYLILSFVISSFFLIFFGLEFIPIVMIVIYVGAVAILFLFVVLMLNIKTAENQQISFAILPSAVIFALIFFSVYYLLLNLQIPTVFTSILSSFYTIDFLEFSNFSFFHNISGLFNTPSIGCSIFTRYLYSFLLSGIILLLAMLSTITLTLQRSFSSKSQLVYDQVLVSQKNLRFV